MEILLYTKFIYKFCYIIWSLPTRQKVDSNLIHVLMRLYSSWCPSTLSNSKLYKNYRTHDNRNFQIWKLVHLSEFVTNGLLCKLKVVYYGLAL